MDSFPSYRTVPETQEDTWLIVSATGKPVTLLQYEEDLDEWSVEQLGRAPRVQYGKLRGMLRFADNPARIVEEEARRRAGARGSRPYAPESYVSVARKGVGKVQERFFVDRRDRAAVEFLDGGFSYVDVDKLTPVSDESLRRLGIST